MTTATPVPLRAATGSIRDGVMAVAPMAAGNVPFALVLGAALAEHHAGLAGWSGSWLVFGGSAELAALQTSAGSGALIALLTGVLVNARMAVYAASLGRRWAGQPRWFRFVASMLIVDPTWAMTVAEPLRSPVEERRRFLAAGVFIGAAWMLGLAVGFVFGARIHLSALDAVAPLCLVTMLVPRARRRGHGAVALVAGSVALIGVRFLDPSLTIALAVAAGVLAGRRGGDGSP